MVISSGIILWRKGVNHYLNHIFLLLFTMMEKILFLIFCHLMSQRKIHSYQVFTFTYEICFSLMNNLNFKYFVLLVIELFLYGFDLQNCLIICYNQDETQYFIIQCFCINLGSIVEKTLFLTLFIYFSNLLFGQHHLNSWEKSTGGF